MSSNDRAPAVSVVVPCYNGGRYIDRVLASLAGQTFHDFEIVVVDDGSTDAQTVEKLDALPPPIRLVRQENRGLSGARNTGFRAAKAAFVLPLDCDDEIEPEFLSVTVEAMRAAPEHVGVVFTHLRFGGAASGVIERSFHPFDLLFSNGMQSCVLVRKAAWAAAGGYDEAMREGYEDWEFFLRLALAGYDGIEIPRPLFIYNLATTGMLLGQSSRVHGKLWRYMRRKHRDAYRLPSILRLWWKTRARPGRVSLAKGLAALTLAVLLPDRAYSALVAAIRNRRFRKSAEAGQMGNPAAAGSQG